jgi:hypothetical protein
MAVILRVLSASSSCADSLALKPNREAQRVIVGVADLARPSTRRGGSSSARCSRMSLRAGSAAARSGPGRGRRPSRTRPGERLGARARPL